MTASEFLDKAELRELTGVARSKAQADWLTAQGVSHRVDGARVIVSRLHVRQWLEGAIAPASTGPNWAALNDSPRFAAPKPAPKPMQSLQVRRDALYPYYADRLDKLDSAKLACREFYRIPTEGRASMHFAKCEACLTLRARYFPDWRR